MKNPWIFAIVLVCLSPVASVAQANYPYALENVPIAFLGKVIDQNGQPVTNAKVSYLLIITDYAMNSGEQKAMTLETDQNGNFLITGVTGHAIDKISIEKEGYELSQKAERGFLYSLGHVFHPDLKHPQIFKMWKESGKEPLVSSNWHGKVACDGTTNRFDLISGHPTADGSIEIICSKVPLNLPPPGNAHFDSKFQIIVAGGGGIQATEDEFTYVAPENGYLPSITIAQKADDPKWQGSVKQEFYIKTAEGHYGRLSVDWYAWQTPPVHLEWNCSVNPSGSRNLER